MPKNVLSLSLADILTAEQMKTLTEIDLSPEYIIKKFEEDPRIQKVTYNPKENRFYVIFEDGEKTYFKIHFPS